MADRTGEIGEPCGVPTNDGKGSESPPLNFNLTDRSTRKDRVQLTSSGANPMSSTSCTSLRLLTLSKNPAMSKRLLHAVLPHARF